MQIDPCLQSNPNLLNPPTYHTRIGKDIFEDTFWVVLKQTVVAPIAQPSTLQPRASLV